MVFWISHKVLYFYCLPGALRGLMFRFDKTLKCKLACEMNVILYLKYLTNRFMNWIFQSSLFPITLGKFGVILIYSMAFMLLFLIHFVTPFPWYFIMYFFHLLLLFFVCFLLFFSSCSHVIISCILYCITTLYIFCKNVPPWA